MNQLPIEVIKITLGQARQKLQSNWAWHPRDAGFQNADVWLSDLVKYADHKRLKDELVIVLDEVLGEVNGRD